MSKRKITPKITTTPKWVILLLIIVGLLYALVNIVGFGLQLKNIIELPNGPRKIITSTLPVQPLWQIKTAPIQDIQAKNQLLLLSTAQGIIRLNPKTGRELWHLSGYLLEPNNFTTDKLVFGLGRQTLEVADLNTGQILWQKNLGQIVSFHSMVQNNTIYVRTYKPTTIYALNLDNGQIIWQIDNLPYQMNIIWAYPQGIMGMSGQETHFWDFETGQLKQKRPFEMLGLIYESQHNTFYGSDWWAKIEPAATPHPFFPPNASAGSCRQFRPPYTFKADWLYAVGYCDGVFGFKNHAFIWSYPTTTSARGRAAWYQGVLYVMLDNGEIHALNPETGSNLGILTTNGKLPGIESNGFALVATDDALIATFNSTDVWAFCASPCSNKP